MATQSPFSWLEGLLQNVNLPKLQPPEWAISEVQHRIVLLLNHVLMQESEATARLVRQSGRVVLVQWRTFSFKLQATPAGLLDLAALDAQADLVLTATEESPLALAQSVFRGDKPAVRIEGDVQLAAEVNWLTEHVRWDIEDDLARILGDVPARMMCQWTTNMAAAVRQFVAKASTLVPGQAAR
jgi:ubiquinone biosynthesis accessory factor UbiJ